MSDKMNDGGPAFPTTWPDQCPVEGMSLRAYAAIELRQPDIGIDWLDAMITKAKRDDFAAHCIQASLGANLPSNLNKYQAESYARYAYMVADAMIAAREAKP